MKVSTRLDHHDNLWCRPNLFRTRFCYASAWNQLKKKVPFTAEDSIMCVIFSAEGKHTVNATVTALLCCVASLNFAAHIQNVHLVFKLFMGMAFNPWLSICFLYQCYASYVMERNMETLCFQYSNVIFRDNSKNISSENENWPEYE